MGGETEDEDVRESDFCRRDGAERNEQTKKVVWLMKLEPAKYHS